MCFSQLIVQYFRFQCRDGDAIVIVARRKLIEKNKDLEMIEKHRG